VSLAFSANGAFHFPGSKVRHISRTGVKFPSDFRDIAVKAMAVQVQKIRGMKQRGIRICSLFWVELNLLAAYNTALRYCRPKYPATGRNCVLWSEVN
jgi:hypothetical protein